MPSGKKIDTDAAKLRVHVYPDEVLRRAAEPVPKIDEASLGEELCILARRMMATMHAEEGVGLAAPQVGRSVRLVVIRAGGIDPGVIDPTGERHTPLVLVNPVIVDASGRGVMEEGCLSVPGVKGKVRRRDRVTVEYETLAGEKAGFDADGLLARVVQHEIDHLDGTLFIDRLGPAGKLAVRKALRELAEAARK